MAFAEGNLSATVQEVTLVDSVDAIAEKRPIISAIIRRLWPKGVTNDRVFTKCGTRQKKSYSSPITVSPVRGRYPNFNYRLTVRPIASVLTLQNGIALAATWSTGQAVTPVH